MRTLAKVAVVLFCFIAPLSLVIPLILLFAWPLLGLISLPIAWYVLFTLPEQRAAEFEILRCLATREPTP